MGVWDVTFWDRCVVSDQAGEMLENEIQTILLPQQQRSSSIDENLQESRKLLNRLCDVGHKFYEENKATKIA
jgi:hypothetical protein